MFDQINASFLADSEKKSAALIASFESNYRKCDWKLKKVEQQLDNADAIHKKADARLTDIQAKAIFPEMFESAKQLKFVTLQLAVSKYNHANDLKDKEKLQSRNEQIVLELYQTKKEKKELEQTFDELTVNLSAEVKAQKDELEKEILKKELAVMKELLKAKTEENEEKDQQIAEIKQDIKVYQRESEKGFARQLAASEAYIAELQYAFESAMRLSSDGGSSDVSFE